jgi:hypothetical protein
MDTKKEKFSPRTPEYFLFEEVPICLVKETNLKGVNKGNDNSLTRRNLCKKKSLSEDFLFQLPGIKLLDTR